MNTEISKYYLDLVNQAGLDMALIGDQVAKGKQHRVFRYGDKQVIKMPRRSLFMRAYGGLKYSQVKSDLAYLKQDYGSYLPETEVYKAGRLGGYVILQDYINSAQSVYADRAYLVAEQLRNMVSVAQKQAIEDSIYLDFFGYAGLIGSLKAMVPFTSHKAFLANIALKQNKLYIVDINLLRVGRHSKQYGLFHRLSDATTVLLSSLLLAYFFKQSLPVSHFMLALQFAFREN